jgi:hypothetical protein
MEKLYRGPYILDAYCRQGQFLFLIGYCLKKSSPLKLLGKMGPNLARSIYVRSSIKLLHLVPFGLQTWPPRLILFSDFEWRVGLSDTILKGTHSGTIYAKFGSIWPSCFRGEDFFNISQSEKRINLGLSL